MRETATALFWRHDAVGFAAVAGMDEASGTRGAARAAELSRPASPVVAQMAPDSLGCEGQIPDVDSPWRWRRAPCTTS